MRVVSSSKRIFFISDVLLNDELYIFLMSPAAHQQKYYKYDGGKNAILFTELLSFRSRIRGSRRNAVAFRRFMGRIKRIIFGACPGFRQGVGCNGQSALDYAKQGAETLMRKFTVEELPPKNRFHYHQGVYLSGVERTYLLSGEQKFYDYIKDWIDSTSTSKAKSASAMCANSTTCSPPFCCLTFTADRRRALQEGAGQVRAHCGNVAQKRPGRLLAQVPPPEPDVAGYLVYDRAVQRHVAKEFGKDYLFEIIYQTMNLMRRNMTDPKRAFCTTRWMSPR
jgi:hypothetical protein